MFEERKFYQIFKELIPIFHKRFQQTEEEHNLTHLGGQYYALMQIRRRHSAKILNKIAKQSNRQGRLWSTKRVTEFRQENVLVIANTLFQHQS